VECHAFLFIFQFVPHYIILPDRKTRDEFLKMTNEANVMTRPAWRLLNKLEMYRDCQTDELTNAQWLEDRVVSFVCKKRERNLRFFIESNQRKLLSYAG